MDKHEKNMIFTIRDDERREQHHHSSGRKKKKIDHWNKGMEKKMPTSATNDLGKHPSKKVRTELLDYQQRKE